MKVLVVSPHMDDEVLGVGGTIARHVHVGHEVYVCFIAHRIYERKYDKIRNQKEVEHALDAKNTLGYKEAEFFSLNDERLDSCIQDIIIPLEDSIFKIKPDIVYSPFYGDNHQDHRAVFQAVRVAIRPSAKVTPKKWLLYETPSSTDQSPPLAENAFLPNYYVDISLFIDKKLMAYKCYKNEERGLPHPRSEEAIRILASRRGIESGFNAAESFMILREKWE